jgi:hypothetical protein
MAANRPGIRRIALRLAGVAAVDSHFLADRPGRMACNAQLSELPRRGNPRRI